MRLKKSKSTASCASTNIGSVLIQMGFCSHEQVDHAKRIQKDVREKLGEILVSLEYVSRADLLKALDVQKKLRTGREPEAHFEITSCRLDRQGSSLRELRDVTTKLITQG